MQGALRDFRQRLWCRQYELRPRVQAHPLGCRPSDPRTARSRAGAAWRCAVADRALRIRQEHPGARRRECALRSRHCPLRAGWRQPSSRALQRSWFLTRGAPRERSPCRRGREAVRRRGRFGAVRIRVAVSCRPRSFAHNDGTRGFRRGVREGLTRREAHIEHARLPTRKPPRGQLQRGSPSIPANSGFKKPT